MRKLIAIFCLISLAQVSYAALDRNYFEYDLAPYGTAADSENSDTSATSENNTTQTTVEVTKRRGFKGQGASESNTYWDFGRPNYGYTGDIQ